ncbi:FkbM family methyltransferase [Fuscibacter oryzae]|uniref:FkbM family methyltransferase n=1 Tax=Fuscibacter oryzae TaxID=2803939 RepID=A0A8J7SVI9_9RHOB|nr:FkbM family methyltransferase [Fuscibacter oryzae]MBL4927879.1 FkbM family methyltransferase [Fuscibacter oryzae]
MTETLSAPAALLQKALSLPRLTTITDVGANPVNPAPYSALLAAGGCRIVGFEPQPSAYAALQKRPSPNETYFPVAVGDGTPVTLHVMRSSGMTSTLPPYEPGLAVIGRPRWGQMREQIQMQTAALDDLPDLPEFDMLKIDIQGGEGAVLAAASRVMQQCVCVIIELRYQRLYEGEPMLGGIDTQLRALGFELHKFMFNKSLMLPNSQSARLRPRRLADQLIDGDAVYVRDLTGISGWSSGQVGHLALLACATFDSHSLALLCLDELVRRGAVDPNLPASYVDALPAHLRTD